LSGSRGCERVVGHDVCTITLCDGQPMGEEALTDVINFAARTNNTQIIEGGGLQQSKSKADDSKIGISVKNRSKGGVRDV